MANEEIMVKFGAETGAVDRALRGLTASGKKFASDFRGSLDNAFARLAAPLSMAGLYLAFDKLAERVDTIKRMSETSGIGTDMVQDLGNLARSAGIAENSVEKMVRAFAKNLKAGADPSEELAKIADHMAKMTDPGERARYAVEMLGEAGLKLIPILSKGSAEVKRLGEEMGRISESQIDVIDNAGDVLDKWKNKALVFGANIVEGISLYASALKRTTQQIKDYVSGGSVKPKNMDENMGDISAENAEAEKAQRHNKELARTQAKKDAAVAAAKKEREEGLKAVDELIQHDRDRAFKRADDEKKIKMLQEDWFKAARDYNKGPMADRIKALDKMHEIESSILDIMGRQSAKADELSKKVRDAAGALQDTIDHAMDQFKPSLDELATTSGPMQSKAVRVKELQGQAKAAFIHGDTRKVGEIRDELYGTTDPTKAQQDELRRIRAANAQRKIDGLKLIPEPDPKSFGKPGLVPQLMDGGMTADPVVVSIQKANDDLIRALVEQGIFVKKLAGG